MKYILAKDLPFAKAGTEVKIKFNEILIMTEKGSPFGHHLYSYQFLQHLIDSGWIKKAEPREFYLLNNRELSDRMFYRSMEEFEKDAANWAVKDLIKVREVIE